MKQDLISIYNLLPEEFTYQEAEEACLTLGYNEKRFRRGLQQKDFKSLFQVVRHGIYKKQTNPYSDLELTISNLKMIALSLTRKIEQLEQEFALHKIKS